MGSLLKVSPINLKSTNIRVPIKKQIDKTCADSIQGYKYRDSCSAMLHSVSDNNIAISNIFNIEQREYV